MIQIKPITSREILEEAIECAKRDGHVLVAPSHVIIKDDAIVGAVTMLATSLVWTDSSKVKVRDSMSVLDSLTNFFSMQGQRCWCAPCVKSSPYHSFLVANKFINLGSYDLFVKGL